MFLRFLASVTIRPGGLGRSVAVMAGGAAGAQAINALVSPILTRLYVPAELGQLGLYLSFLYVAAMIVSLRYEHALVAAPEDVEASQIAVLAIAIVPLMSFGAAVILLLLILTDVAAFGSLPTTTVFWGWAALVLLGIFMVLRYCVIREGSPRVIAEVALAQGIARAGVQVGAGFLGLGLTGLVAGDLVGRGVGIGRLSRQIGHKLAEQARAIRRIHARRLLWAYRKFPALGVPSSLVNALALIVPLPIIAALYGLEAAGHFSLVQRVLWFPIVVVGTAAADALHGRIAKHARQAPEAAASLFDRAAIGLLAIAAIFALVVAAFGPPLFEFVFGLEWKEAGRLARSMAPWLLSAMVVSPLSRVVLVYQRQELKLFYDVLSLALVSGSLLLSARAGLDVVAAVLVLSFSQLLAYALYFVILRRIVARGVVTAREM